MKPRTRIQKEVARLSRRLPAISETQKAYAYRHCFKHFGRRTAKGIIHCTECGHSWKGGHTLADTICGCKCPHCGMELEVLDTRKRVFGYNEYFSIITTCKQYQVIRFFFVKAFFKMRQPAQYSICEVVQRWIAPDGKTETVARLRRMSLFYYDLWAEYSGMEIRSNKKHRAYDITPYCTYPRQRIIPEIRRNGFRDEFHDIRPYDLFTAILSNPKAETLLKTGQYQMLNYYLRYSFDMEKYWASIKICIRNGHIIKDGSMWRDMIDLLHHFGMDTKSPKYVCPSDIKAEHDRLVRKRNRQREREELAKRRREAEKHEDEYRKLKGRFFGILITDGTLNIRVLESVAEFAEEGTAMRHCVWSNNYYLKKYSLILSATIDGKRIETVEVSLKTFKVVQSRGVCNENTEYHDRIISLVDSNMSLIRKRMRTKKAS